MDMVNLKGVRQGGDGAAAKTARPSFNNGGSP
jgi:hypothetical protein